MIKSSRFIVALIASSALCACVSILPDPEPANVVYRLTTDSVRVKSLESAPVIRIDTPSAARLISGREIVVSPDAQRLAVAGGAEWADSLPRMVQQTFLDVLGERADIVGVIPIAGARANYRIHVNIDNFEARFDQGPENAPTIIVAYSATFAASSTRNLVSTKQVTQKVRASSASVSAIVNSMDSANREALGEIADWISSLNLGA